MPATRSRISASSSTINISACMRSPCSSSLLQFRLGARRLALRRNPHPHESAALTGDALGSVAQLDPAAVLLDDAADDGKAEPRALFAGGHVRFEQPAASVLRQTDAVVDHIDDDVLAVTLGKHADDPLAEFRARHRGDRLGGVLDDVGQRLGYEA